MAVTTYTVLAGQSIRDVTVNATGSISGKDAILAANGLMDWTPSLLPGSVLTIPTTAPIDTNIQRTMQIYPAANNVDPRVYQQIDDLMSNLTDNWILKSGFWNDQGVWIDTSIWN